MRVAGLALLALIAGGCVTVEVQPDAGSDATSETGSAATTADFSAGHLRSRRAASADDRFNGDGPCAHRLDRTTDHRPTGDVADANGLNRATND